MRHTSLVPLLLLLLLVIPGLVGTQSAHADEWSDARKAFRKAQKDPDVHVRSNSYMDLLSFDGTEQTGDAVDEMFRALGKERSPSVILAGIEALSTFLSEEAIAAVERTVQRGRGERRLHALLALADRPAGGGEGLLLEVLEEGDEPLVAQAALALGRRRNEEALPLVLPLLEHDAWQLRAAAARTLKSMAGDAVKDAKTGEAKLPPLPSWLDATAVSKALVKSLETAEGRAISDIVKALERINLQSYGGDVKAWQALAEGRDPKTIRARPPTVPTICGVPIRGKRVVVILDISTCTDDTHPFQDLARLKEVLKVPGGRPAALPTVRTRKEFMAAHAKRLVLDLPMRGYKFEVIAVFQKVEGLFGKLTTSNSGTKRSARRFITELSVQNGPNHFLALNEALDISGTKDSVAWSLGPDEIILMTCSVPWAPKDPSAVVNQTEVGAAIGLKARLRMVPIHMIGVGSHPYEMMKLISDQSGGDYVDLSK